MLRYGLLALVMAAVASPAPAQMDWLSPHLEAKRHDNVRKRQQRNAQAQQENRQGRSQAERPVTLAERQDAWSRNKSEYRRKMLREGPRAADRWLDQIVLSER